MKRVHNKTVTQMSGFVVLIPATKENASGEATFLMEFAEPQPVRAVTLKELCKAPDLLGVDSAHFGALLALRGAIESRDHLALAQANERMEKVYQLRKKRSMAKPEEDRLVGEALSASFGMSPKESFEYMNGFRSGSRAEANLPLLFSYEVTQAVNKLFQNAQVALWWMNGSFRPAIYCPDMKTALYVHTFFIAPVGGLGYRTCPYDGEQFFQDRSNQEYCCPAHREAHRVARWRDQKKTLNSQPNNKKEEKDGTNETR